MVFITIRKWLIFMEKIIDKTIEAEIKIKFRDRKDGYSTPSMSLQVSNKGHRLRFESGHHNSSSIGVTTNDLREIAEKLIQAADEIDADPDFK